LEFRLEQLQRISYLLAGVIRVAQLYTLRFSTKKSPLDFT